MEGNDYLICEVYGVDLGQLQREVGRLMLKGYRPLGGPLVLGAATETVRMVQAMIRNPVEEALKNALTKHMGIEVREPYFEPEPENTFDVPVKSGAVSVKMS